MVSKNQASLLRIAASSYLNTAPLIWSFIHGSRQNSIDLLTDRSPGRCCDMLQNGDCDAALVPVIEYQRIPDLVVVPDVCVGARNHVGSVVLITEKDSLKEIDHIALDVSSRTSAVLIQIIFREFIGTTPRVSVVAPDLPGMLRTHSAALVIGDPAMHFERDGFEVYDLAALWRKYTGLGFVFAMWMANRVNAHKVLTTDFSAVRDEGLANVDAIIAEYLSKYLARTHAVVTNLSVDISVEKLRAYLRAYLLDQICFHVDNELRAG
ncbi:MAG: menaquinone biosynthetic enzyme MqnA/MqnD family protein, partial [Pyrinomonadaceae bacterium]